MSVATETGAESTIFRLFERIVEADPRAVAIYEDDVRITRGDLLSRSLEIAATLRAQGVASGDTVAVKMRNSTPLLATIVAALHLRVTILPIDRDARQAEWNSILEQFSARALLQTGSDGDLTVDLTGRSGRPAATEGVALIKLTSGSTGRPRGVLTTEANLIADCRNICATMGITPTDINLGAIPFSHSYGFSNLVTPLLLQGTSLVVSNDYLPVPLIELCNRHGVTFLPGIPMMFDHLSRLPEEDGTFATVRRFISAGAPLTPAVAHAFRERHGHSIHTFYGCSECGAISYDRMGGAAERGTVGAPIKHVDLEIDAASQRLRVRSDAVAAGYTNATDEERSRFSPHRFLTDDLVETTADGEIRITGRANALINIAGKKVNPREVENVILSLDGVREVSVLGAPAGARGEVVMAVVVADPAVTRPSIRSHCQKHLSAHKVPRIIRFLDRLPVDERGKVRKSELL